MAWAHNLLEVRGVCNEGTWSFSNYGYKIKQISPTIQHGEGPLYHRDTNTLYWVDTFKATVYRLTEDGDVQSYELEERDSIGFILPVKGKTDTFLVFADRVVYKMRWPLDQTKEVELKTILEIEADKPNNQFNDGKVDCEGRVWGGTLTRNKDLTVSSNGGALYTFNNIFTNVVPKITNTSISNGLGWTGDSHKFYYIDSETKVIEEYTFEPDTGSIRNKRIVFDLTNHTELTGIADGMTVDKNGNLWIALFGGGHVIQVDPDTKKILRKIRMPVTYVTSLEFGGPNLNVLFVTTSKLKLEQRRLGDEPSAGSVFAITGLGVKGVPQTEVVYQEDNYI